jgi:TonB family protein
MSKRCALIRFVTKNALKAALESFSLTPDWFTVLFGKERGATLQKDYQDQFAYFELEQLRKLHTIETVGGPEFEVCPNHPPTAVKPAPTSLVPLPDARMVVTRANFASWGDLYAEVDGTYRFFGTGGYPFWDPGRIRLADTCNPGVPNGGQITKRVEPRYPNEARASRKTGKVTMLLTVSADGSVTDAQIIEGDDVFISAAKDAAMQWRFNPWVNCGKPVMMRTIETVKFAAPS